MSIDYTRVHEMRGEAWAWSSIASVYGVSVGTISKGYTRWKEKMLAADDEQEWQVERENEWPEDGYGDEKAEQTRMVSDISGVQGVDDLAELFGVDLDKWTVSGFRLNSWDSPVAGGGVQTMHQVRANFDRNVEQDVAAGREAIEQAIEDMKAHSPGYAPAFPHNRITTDQSVLYELALMDPHLGMKAWKPETGGGSWDLKLATEAYVKTARQLLALAWNHSVERILIVMGNDTLHVDHLEMGKVGTTTAGTPQDLDTRLPKLFTAARQAIVEVIDEARLVAPVDVLVVPGNHDQHSMYRLGEVLAAWYRLDEEVVVLNAPTRRKYYAFGANLFGFTHGQEFKRKRDPLPLIMATEAPKLWGQSSYREIHCGHFHGAAERTFMAPEDTLTEARGVRMRVLPALTPIDAWHAQEGYAHHRAASALVFKRAGGLVALYEVQP